MVVSDEFRASKTSKPRTKAEKGTICNDRVQRVEVVFAEKNDSSVKESIWTRDWRLSGECRSCFSKLPGALELVLDSKSLHDM